MLTFILCIAALVVGYIFYGKRVDKIFGSDDRESLWTPSAPPPT